MFVLCENMKWSHLPVSGGLYDQSPELLDGLMYIFMKRSEYQEEERLREEGKEKRARIQGASRAR